MSTLLEKFREGTVPRNVLHAAARGELALPPGEMLEILVLLRTHAEAGGEAQRALADWDQDSVVTVCCSKEASPDLLRYFLASRSHAPDVVKAAAGNINLPEETLRHVAASSPMHMLGTLLDVKRVRASGLLLRSIMINPHATDDLRMMAERWLSRSISGDDDADMSEEERGYRDEFGEEIAREEGTLFDMELASPDEKDEISDLARSMKLPLGPARQATPEKLATAALGGAKPQPAKREHEKQNLLQRIAEMSVGDRIKLAMRGERDERLILIRDRCRVVALAVLESPKINETEMESIAGMTNVQEQVLRGVAGKRRFIRNYNVIRALVNNPRVPIEASLPLVPHLLTVDLKSLIKNKNVSDTVHKAVINLFQKRMERAKS